MFRFSLRTLLLVMLLGGPGLAAGWLLWKRWQKPEPLILEDVEVEVGLGGIDIPPDPAVWLQEPIRTGRPTKDDERAFDELLKSVEANQDAELRQQYAVQIPKEPTGLPEDYDLLLYGQHVGRALRRCEVNVRGKWATIENMTIAGIQRGEVPREEIDMLTRELAYAHRCTHAAKPSSDVFGILGGMYASHHPYETIEIISRTNGSPFHLRTEPKQLLADSVSLSTHGVPGFVETQLSQWLDDIAEKRLTPVVPDDAEKKEVLVRLQRLGQPQESDESYERRDELPVVETLLYSHLAVRWRMAAALPELQRLRLTEAETQLRMVTSDGPGPLLEKVILDERARLFHWAIEYAAEHPSPPVIEVLIRSLPHVRPYQVVEILDTIVDVDIAPEQLQVVRTFAAEANTGKTHAAFTAFLLHKTQETEYYEELLRIALEPGSTETGLDEVDLARRELFRYSMEAGGERERTAECARTILSTIDPNTNTERSELRQALKCLGELGTAADVPVLEPYCRNESWGIKRTAINALAHLAPARALGFARAEFERYESQTFGVAETSGLFAGYPDLFFWQRDVDSLALLERALVRYRASKPGRGSWIEKTELLLRYLRSSDVHERTSIALSFWNRDYQDQKWRADVGKRLIAEGADPAACQSLLVPLPRHKSKYW